MEPVRVLLVGCGGREHAIAQGLAQSSIASELYCVGSYRNPELLRMTKSYAECSLDDTGLIVAFARQVRPGLCVVGPEKPLAAGVVDALTEAGFRCVGPPSCIAQLESDKGWCRDFLVKYGMSGLCPAFRIFNGFSPALGGGGSEWSRVAKDNRYQRLKRWDEVKQSVVEWMTNDLGGDYVVKPLGLKGGKGVKVSGDHLHSVSDAIDYCHELFAAGCGFVVEEKLVGQEFSLLTLTDGRACHHFPAATDFKRAYDGDLGPNTGGMGCIVRSNSDPEMLRLLGNAKRVTERVVESVAYEFPECGAWSGVLFGGFLVTTDGRLKVLEYNVRFGDPEAIAVLAAQPVDLLRMMLAAAEQRLGSVLPRLHIPPARDCCVVYVVPAAYPNATAGTVRLQYRELMARVLGDDTERVQLIAAGLTVNGAGITGNARATPLTDWMENDTGSATTVGSATEIVAFTEDADDLLQNNRAQITGSRTFAVVAIGAQGVEQMSNVVFPRLRQQLGDVFRWRTDIAAVFNVELPAPGCEIVLEDDAEDAEISVDRYQAAGVNIGVGNRAVQSIQGLVRSTHTEGVCHVPGGFGGLFRSPGKGLLVSSTDSVGSKSELVRKIFDDRGALSGLGHDIVNHCVNDILVMGCMRPLWFLDYFATHSLEPKELRFFVSGVAQACRNVGCALIGGETAEIKDTYKPGALDLVGCITGTMNEREMLRPHETLEPGDLVYALPSVSAHTNGFTLINKIYREMTYGRARLDPGDLQWFRRLAAPHKCYLEDVRAIQAAGIRIKALVHITGGGLVDNPPRVLPEELAFNLCHTIIEQRMPKMFRKLREAAGISAREEMYRTFNSGVGMLVVVGGDQGIAPPGAFRVGTIERRAGGIPVVFHD